jgi:hypothetical protein
VTDESKRDDLKLGSDELRDRDALKRLPALDADNLRRREREAADSLYPERKIRPARPRSSEGSERQQPVGLGDIEAAIHGDTSLTEPDRERLLYFASELRRYFARGR